jgi:hypothetical protein
MSKGFVYTEVQVSIPFDHVPWPQVNESIKAQPGFIGKTWLSGHGNNSIGGLYEFDTVENAKRFAVDFFPARAKEMGAAFTTRVFGGAATETASRSMNSAHYRA